MEKKVNVLIVDDNESVIDSVTKYFSSHGSIKVVNTCSNGKEALDFILKEPNKFDMILMDIILPELDGLELLERLKQEKIEKKIIIISSYKKDYCVNKVNNYGINYYMQKPFSLESLEKRINEVMDETDNSFIISNEKKDVVFTISNLLHSLGMPSHIKGYQYIRESILMMYDNPDMVGGITKEIYPEIADKYDTTSSRVERAIRHAIEVSWNRGDYDLMEEIFGNSVDYDRAKPTNSEFIATLADKLRVDKKLITV